MVAQEKMAGLAKKTPGQPNPIDIHVGKRLRERRTLLGMSQGKLGETIGLTFQQIQKYERGSNRIGASRLFDLSMVLDVSISFFFEDMPAELIQERYGKTFETGNLMSTEETGEEMMRRETLELVRNYYKVNNPLIRKRLFELAKVLAHTSEQMAEQDLSGT